ncbi:MAG: HD domain-containing protein [Bacilli bacterium]
MAVTIEDLIQKVKSYNPAGVGKIVQAYKIASLAHAGQMRQSGEPYIIHPLEVAYILADSYMDTDTIVSGLLHDSVEDTYLTKEDLEVMFGHDTATIVEGVTNFDQVYLPNRGVRHCANDRKVVVSILTDIRSFYVRLADRLHNMRTLEYLSTEKQIEKAIATKTIFVPIANRLGLNRIKNELEDLSFYYLYTEEYKRIESKVKRENITYKKYINEMANNIDKILTQRDIDHLIKIRTKNLYSIYRDLKDSGTSIKNARLRTIHDLISIKIMLDNVDNCYLMLRPIHELYKPVNGTFKDYICNPKENKYQSLHTTVWGLNDRQVQIQLKTFRMGEVASFGLARYWDINNQEDRLAMLEYVKNSYPFYESIAEINKAYKNDIDFFRHLKDELSTIVVYDNNGKQYEIPKGSTIIDFAYILGEKVATQLALALVNDQEIFDFNYVLQDQDHIRVISNGIAKGPTEEWLDYAHTAKARNMILKYLKK